MNSLSNLWMQHILFVDKYVDFSVFSDKRLSEWFLPLANSITEAGAIPYLLNSSQRFRASPLSSTICWLSRENLIPESVLDKMFDMLLFLKDKKLDNDKEIGNTYKLPEDNDGWSLAEGVSVWSTSLAIIALLDSNDRGRLRAFEFKSAVLWLAQQSNLSSKGWGYQLSKNCTPNAMMTALALRALALAVTSPNKEQFQFNTDEERQIHSAIVGGAEFLKNQQHKSHAQTYWCFNNKPHCAATVWSLMALKQISLINESYSIDCLNHYNKIKESSLAFIVSKIPAESKKWEDEQIVFEGGAKYNKQKNYFSFSATLLPQLFDLGLSPYHPKVINQISWLINNPDDWKITEYDKSSICTFTYAMVISTLVSWARRVGSEQASYILEDCLRKRKITKKLYGYATSEKADFQMLLKKNLLIIELAILILISMFFFGHYINKIVHEISLFILSLWSKSSDDRHDIMINLIATVIYALFVAIISFFIKIIRKIWRNING